VTTGLGAAGAVATQSTAQILAAGAGFTSGTRAEYNQDFFSTLAVEVIVKAFEQVRSKTLETIEDKRTFKLGLTGQGISNSKSISLYTVQMAVADAITYHAQCSLTVGLEEASRSLTLVANPGAEQLRQAMGIVDQLRQQQATGGRDISLGEGSNLQSLLLVYANDIRQNNKNIQSDFSKFENNVKEYQRFIANAKWDKFNDKYNNFKTSYSSKKSELDNYIYLFSSTDTKSFLYKNENYILAKHSAATKAFLDSTDQKAILNAYDEIVKIRTQAINLRLEIDAKKREADRLVKIFGDDLQSLREEIEGLATTPELSVTPDTLIAKVTESVTFTAVLTGNANAYRDGNNTIKWQQNSNANPQPDDKGWTDINEASGETYKRTVEAGDASKTFRAVVSDKAAGSKGSLKSNTATLSVTP
jgi:flagellar biosynthesis chaperone FliJ